MFFFNYQYIHFKNKIKLPGKIDKIAHKLRKV